MKQQAISAFMVTAIAMAPQARAADTQLLFLAEDVPTTLNYDGPSPTVNTSQTGWLNLLEPMFSYGIKTINEDGLRIPDFSKPEGRLVQSWEYDPATLTWTLHLRQDVVGCTGEKFSADDIVYTFARAKSVSGKTTVSWFLSHVAGIKGFGSQKDPDKSLGDAVEKVDDYTVKIRQDHANPFLQLVATTHALHIWDSHVMKAHATPSDPWSHEYANNVNAAGFGPYCLDRWVKGDEFVVRANPHYYRGKAAIDEVVMKKVPQSSNRMVILRSGQAQIVQGLTPREYASLRGVTGIKVAGVFGNETLFISPNFASPLYKNKLLREAIAYGIDYEQVLKTGYLGQARKADGPIPSSFPGRIVPDAQFSYDPAKAKALLAQAGFPDGAGLDKFPNDLKLTYASERETTLGPIATVIRTSLQGVGIPIVLDPIPQTQMAGRRMVQNDLPLALSDIDKSAVIDTLYATLLLYVSHANGGIINVNNFVSPDVDRLYDDAAKSGSPAERDKDLQQIQQIVQGELAMIPIVETKTQWAFSDKLKGLTWYPDNAAHWYDLSLAK
jgi:peptide/nickel transport system substrate-binding protein